MDGNQEGVHDTINKEGLEDLMDFDSQEIRALLTENELVHEGDPVSEDDYEAIKRRARILLSGSEPLSAPAALLTAGVERLNLMEKIGMETLKSMPVASLRAIFYAETKVMFTDEEINLFKGSELPLGEWLHKREEIRDTLH